MQLRLRRRIVPQKSKWSTPLIAAVTSISMVAAAAFGGNQVLRTQENAPAQLTFPRPRPALATARPSLSKTPPSPHRARAAAAP